MGTLTRHENTLQRLQLFRAEIDKAAADHFAADVAPLAPVLASLTDAAEELNLRLHLHDRYE